MTHETVNGVYSDENCFGGLGDASRKLRINFRNQNYAFDVCLSGKNSGRKTYDEGGGNTSGERPGHIEGLSHLAPFATYYGFPEPEIVYKHDLVDEIRTLPSGNQGYAELSTYPSKRLFVHLFQKQVRHWKAIAHRHIDLVADIAEQFIDKLSSHVFVRGEPASDIFQKSYADPFFQCRGSC